MTTPTTRWLIDAGNSRIKCAALSAEGRRGEVSAWANTDPEALRALVDHLRASGRPVQAWLASVAPAALAADLQAALEAAGVRVRRVAPEASRGRLRIAYAEPSRLGVDRFLGLLAASERSDGSWLVVSAGSALTLDLLAADGRHVGGLIAPMPAMMRAALAGGIRQLDVAAAARADFADDTADAIASGCDGAAIGLVERSLRQARERLGEAPTLLLTGGGAELFDGVAGARVVEPALVLDGLAILARGGA